MHHVLDYFLYSTLLQYAQHTICFQFIPEQEHETTLLKFRTVGANNGGKILTQN